MRRVVNLWTRRLGVLARSGLLAGALAALGQLPACGGELETVYAAPDAAPGGDGSRAAPYDSLEAGRDALRPGEGGRLVLLAGTWSRSAPLLLDERDDGLVIAAEQSGGAELLGGVVLDPEAAPQQAEAQALRARLPDAARDAVRLVALPATSAGQPLTLTGPRQRGMGSPAAPVGSEVFVGTAALVRARWPNHGFAAIEAVLDAGSIPRQREADIPEAERETGPERGGVFRPAGVSPARLAAWARASDAWAAGYWYWDWADELLPVAQVDLEAGTVALGLPHRYGLRQSGKFVLTNLLEELDEPGEFFIDAASRTLAYWPPEGAAGRLVVTTLGEPLVSISGATGISLEGLTLGPTRGTAIAIDASEGVSVRDCQILSPGNNGVTIEGKRCAVEDCTILGAGAAGVTLKGGDRATLTPAGNRVERTRIHGFGRLFRTYQPGIRLAGVGQIARDNELAHAPHSALIFSGNEHRIEGNEIFDVLTETGDSGAIYCGRDWTLCGTRIVGNFIHHLGGSAGRWQNAIYLDDMASGIEVARNLIWRCHWGMLIGGGRDLAIHDNTLVDCALGLRFDARGVGWMAKNIADPATSTLHQRLAAVPIEREPWASRYPTLAHYLDDRFGRPAGSRVAQNHFAGTPFGSVDDTEAVEVVDNQLDAEPPAALAASAADFVSTGPRLGERRVPTARLPDPRLAALFERDNER